MKRAQGEHAGLSRDLVLTTAVDLVDQDGVDALSMRKLGAALGVEAMTLYHYVPNKAALLDGLVEWVLENTQDSSGNPGATWGEALHRQAELLRAMLLTHPGVLPLFFTRPAVTPRTLESVERGLGVLCGAGFKLEQAMGILNALNTFVLGHTMNEVGEAAIRRRHGSPAARVLGEVDLSALPLVTQAARHAQSIDAEDRFAFGLDALLAGFAELLDSAKDGRTGE